MAVNAKDWTVLAYGNCNLDPAKLNDSIEQGTGYLGKGIDELLKQHIVGPIHTNRVVMGLSTARTFNRSLSLPLAAEKNLLEAVQIEAEQYIPLPIQQLELDFEITARGKETLEVNICAVPKLIVNNCVAACEAAGLEVVMIEPAINGVARLLTHTEQGELPTVIVDIGAAATDIAVYNRTIRVTGSVAVGGNSFTLDIANALKVPLENAHQLKVLNGLSAGPKQAKITAALDPSLKLISAEIKKIIRYYTERISTAEKLEQVIIVGGGSNVPGIGEFFTNELVMPARVASPWQVLDFGSLQQPSKQFKPRYITVAGLASVADQEIWQ